MKKSSYFFLLHYMTKMSVVRLPRKTTIMLAATILSGVTAASVTAFKQIFFESAEQVAAGNGWQALTVSALLL